MKQWLLRKLLPKPTPQIIPMEEKKAWQVYAEMSRIPNIQDLFELRKQLAYIEAAQQKEKFNSAWGKIEDCEEILENMLESHERLKELNNQPEPKQIERGFKSTIDN